MTKKKPLGKGLAALFSEADLAALEEGLELFYLPVGEIRPNPHQPRKVFEEKAMEELLESIRGKGVLQPVIVRRKEDGYELIAGERRLLAATRAGLAEIPVILKDVSDEEAIEISLVENLQRENLNPVETAEAFRRLVSEFKYTHEALALRVGRDRATITNYLRLLALPEKARNLLAEGKIQMGHARAILPLLEKGSVEEALDQVVTKGLSVRATENLVRRRLRREGKKRDVTGYRHVEEKLTRRLGTKVRVTEKGKVGRIVIEFYGEADLDRILTFFS